MYIKWAIFFYSLKPQIQWGKTLETKGMFHLIELIHSFVVYMQSNHVNSNYRMAWYWYVFLDPFAFSIVEIPGTHWITSPKQCWKGTKLIHWNCIKNDPSSGLFCCWVLGMVDASNLCLWGSHFFQIAKFP